MYSSVCDGRYDSKVMPKSPIVAMIPAVFVGVLFPMCECVIIPIVRRLIQKGLPLHVGIVILLSAPIMNPVVLLSTVYAFPKMITLYMHALG